MDHSIGNLQVTDTMKQTKYRNLTRCLLAVLSKWTTDIATFTVGVKGSIDTFQWRKSLDMVGVPPAQHAQVARMAISKVLDGIDTIIQARAALYRELPLDTVSDYPRTQPPPECYW